MAGGFRRVDACGTAAFFTKHFFSPSPSGCRRHGSLTAGWRSVDILRLNRMWEGRVDGAYGIGELGRRNYVEVREREVHGRRHRAQTVGSAVHHTTQLSEQRVASHGSLLLPSALFTARNWRWHRRSCVAECPVGNRCMSNYMGEEDSVYADSIEDLRARLAEKVHDVYENDPDASMELFDSLDREQLLVLLQVLDNGEAEQKQPKEASRKQLWLLAISSCIPFIGFGFVDNFIMIVAGDYLDRGICVILGFSTMAAAALGNLISDLMGIGLGGYIERVAHVIGFAQPNMTKQQMEAPRSRWWYHAGSAVGVAIGCILGMVPLIFIDTQAADRMKKQKAQDELFGTATQEIARVMNAEKCVLYLVKDRLATAEHDCFCHDWERHGEAGDHDDDGDEENTERSSNADDKHLRTSSSSSGTISNNSKTLSHQVTSVFSQKETSGKENAAVRFPPEAGVSSNDAEAERSGGSTGGSPASARGGLFWNDFVPADMSRVFDSKPAMDMQQETKKKKKSSSLQSKVLNIECR
eukprot:GHVQ01018912.1.p1 GENE.GHVQ01018912.1~~GHVQ01018912.1.p1  ORF type:complete len:526 (-),score=80.37 GHVQ01018912.1:1394-2971(-)